MKREYLPLESLPAWLRLNGISSNGVAFQRFGSADNATDKGSAIVATQDKCSKESDALPEVLLQIPSDLLLSLDTVLDYSKSDQNLREVLEAVGEFGRTARGAIMVFFLIQMTHSSPDTPRSIGVSNPWTEYIKFLPSSFPLPTSYSEQERELLKGTSLAALVEAKITSLEQEFDYLRKATENIAWCRQCWWNEDGGSLTFHDWVYTDAAYRSRMVDLPRRGHAMVPCIDMANHVSGESVKALYDADAEGNAILQLRWGQSLRPGDEVTISYGDEKSASEMVFSYGFLENDRTEAKQAILDIKVPDDDPLGVAKRMICQEAPGVRVSDTPESNPITRAGIVWEGPLIWWASVNEEDGLHIGVAQTTDGRRELETTWRDKKIQSPHQLRELLATDPLWDIFQLRAIVLVLQRLETQLSLLQETEEALLNIQDQALLDSMFRPEVFSLLSRLRKYETVLLERAVEQLMKQRNELMESDTVVAYLNQQSQADEDEDFS
ncbi:uncharacterized protein N7459_007301 [Penicillium hispanicum]|uniref:uncharacterized protein n=1 Tax=Penicillium hispanicum TaxID=1080232 RepID=UPI002540A078|nr:uncharacterized protein N7459_007301 [Penicillium hispanicum]KAJ5578337.1 hypothetical protein N7459_007301 [Penicillium hispanicum]